MQTGTIVKYKQHPEDEYDAGFPAIVMREWQDGSLQLYVLQFDHPTNIRAAHPTQVEAMIDPDKIINQEWMMDALRTTVVRQERRILALEERVSALSSYTTPPPVESTPPETPLEMDYKGLTVTDSQEAAEPVTVSRKKSAWPKN